MIDQPWVIAMEPRLTRYIHNADHHPEHVRHELEQTALNQANERKFPR